MCIIRRNSVSINRIFKKQLPSGTALSNGVKENIKTNLKMDGTKMSRVKRILIVASAALLLLAGCSEEQKINAVERICVPAADKAVAMKLAEDVLGQMHFGIAKSDVEQGYIRTRPLQGAQFFEFWRNDNVGAFNSSEANLHSIRRIVELDFSRQSGQLCVNCSVKTQRLSIPEHQISGGSRANRIFSSSGSSTLKFGIYPEQKKAMSWIDLGTDPRFETHILARLEKRLAKL